MTEQAPKTMREIELEYQFSNLERIFESIGENPEDPQRRIVADRDNTSVSLLRIDTSAQDAFIVRLGETTFYESRKNGVEWISMPKLGIYIGASKIGHVPNSPFIINVPPEERLDVAKTLNKRTSSAIKSIEIGRKMKSITHTVETDLLYCSIIEIREESTS